MFIIIGKRYRGYKQAAASPVYQAIKGSILGSQQTCRDNISTTKKTHVGTLII